MNYVYLVAAVLISVHVGTYGLWLNKNGYKAGAIFAFFLALTCVGLPVYRAVIGP